MHWLLAGCCGLALVHLSVALQISQKPRFLGVRANHKQVPLYCMSSNQQVNATVEWFKAATYNSERKELASVGKIEFHTRELTENAYMQIKNLHIEDSGVYFCKINDTWGPGTQIKVVRITSRENAEYRSRMKDGLIILQGLLLAVCIAAIMMRKQKLLEKSDSEYEEPEIDHIYEGLAIETCGGGLYEDLTQYTQPDTEAPWE